MNGQAGLYFYTAALRLIVTSRFLLLASLAFFWVIVCPAQATVRTWTGFSGDWNEAANWSPSGVPANGDTLVFGHLPAGRTKVTTNDIPTPRSFTTLVFQEGGYAVRGKAIGITRSILVSQTRGRITIYCDLVLSSDTIVHLFASQAMLTVNGQIIGIKPPPPPHPPVPQRNPTLTVGTGTKSTVALNGKVSGISALMKIGNGVLALSGDNDYMGPTTVFQGDLRVTSETALGTTSGGTTVRTGARLAVAVADGSSLAEPLTLSGGTLYVVSGSLIWDGPINVLDGTFDCPTDAALRVNGVIRGTGGLTKTGPGELYLMNSNTYEGLTTLNEGTVYVGNTSALGSTAQGTVIKGSAILSLGGFSDFPTSLDMNGESLEFAGTNSTLYYYGLMTWRGAITVDPSSTGVIWGRRTRDFPYQYSTLEIPGTISGTGNLTFWAEEFQFEAVLEGNAANTLSGITKVYGGQLVLKKPADTVAVAGPLEVRGYELSAVAGRVSVVADGQFGGPSQNWIAMYNGGQLMLNGHKVQTNQLFMHTGSVHLGQNGQLILWNGYPAIVSDSGGTIDYPPEGGTLWVGVLGDGEIEVEGNRCLTIGAKIMNDGEIFSKTGGGCLELIGDINTATVRVQEGILQADGSRAYKAEISNTGILAGVGVVGDVTGIEGTVRPGKWPDPGRLTVGDLDLVSTKVEVKLNGMNAGTEYAQIKVNGSVTLSSATLNVSLGFQPAVGSSFVIVDNDGADHIVGTFVDLPEGAQFVISGTTFQISYHGGDGNDVELKRI